MRARDYPTAAREMARAESAWPTQPTYVWGLAVTSAIVGDTATVLRALGTYADFALGNDLRADTIFAGYVARPQFAAVVARHDSNRAPMVRSRVLVSLGDTTLWPDPSGSLCSASVCRAEL